MPGEQPQYLQGLGPELDRLAIGRAQLGALRIELKTRKAQHVPSHRQLSPFSPRIDRKNVPKRTGAPNIRKISECLNSNLRTVSEGEMRGMGKLKSGSRAEWGLRCRTGARTSARSANGDLGATFEGEFSNVTRSYAGKGFVRYVW